MKRVQRVKERSDLNSENETKKLETRERKKGSG